MKEFIKNFILSIFLVGILFWISTNVSFAAQNLVNPGFETGDLTGWSKGTVVDFAGVVGPDGYNTPNQGNYMLRLGTPRYIGQPQGPNTVFQDFVVVNPTLTFAYDLFTYDYYGYDWFQYVVTDLDTNTNIVFYDQTAWGWDLGLKTTGWRIVNVDLSQYMGKHVRLAIDVEGRGDYLYSTWVYVDSAVPPDSIPPVTTISLYGTLGNKGWYTSDVLVSLQATDEPGGSGVNRTEYSFDNVTWHTYAVPFPVTNEGTTMLYYRSVDNAGNIEKTKTETIKIDKTPPVVVITSPQNNKDYYHTGLLTLDFSSTDAVSGIATMTAMLDATSVNNGQIVSLKTLALGKHTLNVRAQDVAGNATTASAQFNVIPIPFSSFSAKIEAEVGENVAKNQLEAKGTFTLGQQSDGIDPVNEPVILSFFDVFFEIPPGSFKLGHEDKDKDKDKNEEHEDKPGNNYKFEGTINGAKVEMKIKSLGNNNYEFKFEAEGLSLCWLKNPTDVKLTIGDDSGATQAGVEIEDLKNWDKVCPGIPVPNVPPKKDEKPENSKD